eukprot:CAMPEP_0184872978 /NCGR_PEP_ID=MMETSP0580-20130426/41589_1 /TAXON_ID=1118495 /ORGANISM="Dactyliosolen fragilissimus" /LENGTH=674 /DNA_ID=CAMNT_0027375837 /DNA_START=116 /DNA_END=2136 /DNA_ORIENTATION=+
MANETRQRHREALESKKLKLEKLRRDRAEREAQRERDEREKAMAATTIVNDDDYLKELLSDKPPSSTGGMTGTASGGNINTSVATTPTKQRGETLFSGSVSSPMVEDGSNAMDTTMDEDGGEGREGGDSSRNKDALMTTGTSDAGTDATMATDKHNMKVVETFTFGTQTEDLDFPPSLVSEDAANDTKEDNATDKNDKDDNSNDKNTKTKDGTNEENQEAPVIVLSKEKSKEVISSTQPAFSNFFLNASKRVERVLGAPLLADLLVDDDIRYSLQEDPNYTSQGIGGANTNPQHPHHTSKYLVASSTYTHPRWSQGRRITQIDWSPHRRGEVLLTSCHSPNSIQVSSSSSTTTNDNTPITPSKNDPSSSYVYSTMSPSTTNTTTTTTTTTTNTAIGNERKTNSSYLGVQTGEKSKGLVLVWNLSMTNRPEHVFATASPVCQSKFHPKESNLVIGGCYDGRIVVWDARAASGGRLPVQMSAVDLMGTGGSVGGGVDVKSKASFAMKDFKSHCFPIVAMDFLKDGSELVTASSDGKINIWSLSNLREPADTMYIPLLGICIQHCFLLHPLIIRIDESSFCNLSMFSNKSELVTASSDGKINIWSLSNLREPADTMYIPDIHISSLAITQGGRDSIVLGDEAGALHAIVAANSSTAKKSHLDANMIRTTTTLNKWER